MWEVLERFTGFVILAGALWLARRVPSGAGR
jgi:thiol:disulfide interchange protein